LLFFAQRLASKCSKGNAFEEQLCDSIVAFDGMLVVGTKSFTKGELKNVITSNLLM